MTDEHRVWFTRYGVRHYYSATSKEDADRWIRIYRAIGGVEINSLEFHDGTEIEMSGQTG